MGGVGIAYDDALQDPFINPAKLRRLRHGVTFFSPAWNTWALDRAQNFSNAGNVNSNFGSHLVSLPFGKFGRGERSSAGLFFTLQLLNEQASSEAAILRRTRQAENDFTAVNVPIFALWGMDIPKTNFSAGAGIDFAYLRGVEGVSFLYPNFDQLDQEGLLFNFRLGLAGTLSEKDEISFLGMRHHYKAHHEANRTIENKDQNHGWLLRAEYRRLLTPQWRAGLQITGNWKKHPKIPDYPLSGVPRDPGTTHAYDFGVGLSWKIPYLLIATEAIYEPIDTKTWVEAESPIQTNDGRYLNKGEITIRNDYKFFNRILRLGVEAGSENWLALRAGVQAKVFKYDYHHLNVLTSHARWSKPHSQWTEMTWTGGVSFRRDKKEWLYTLQVITGNSFLRARPRRPEGYKDFTDFLIPPVRELNFDRVPMFMQQVSVIWHL
jgi:hypothetical protein